MAVFGRGIYKYFRHQQVILAAVAENKQNIKQIFRTVYAANHLSRTKEPKPCDYEYEISHDKNEWKYVERLMPLKLVPPVSEKKEYPSGWRPQTAKARTHPYYIERTKNHMLPVYMHLKDRGQWRTTSIGKISGDLWKLHDELKEHLEMILQKRVFSFINEGNCKIIFKGDHVYYCQQWLLERGF